MDNERRFSEGDMFTYININDVTCVMERVDRGWVFVAPPSHVDSESEPLTDAQMLSHVIGLLNRNDSRLRWGFVHTGGRP